MSAGLPASATVQPLVSQQLHRSLVVCANSNSILIRPTESDSGLRIDWSGAVHRVDGPLDMHHHPTSRQITVEGIAGLVQGGTLGTLIVITESENVGEEIFGVKSVLSIPLSKRAIEVINAFSIKQSSEKDAKDNATSSDDGESDEGDDDDGGQESEEEEGKELELEDNGIVSSSQPSFTATLAASGSKRRRSSVLAARFVREAERELTVGQYFSRSIDITRSLQHKQEIREAAIGTGNGACLVEPNAHLPLWRRADRRFWYNHYLLRPLIDLGLHSYILVLMQGYVQSSSIALPIPSPIASSPLTLPPSPASLALAITIISRRSIERPGLRFQRRGVDSNGSVANFVETEFITRCVRDGVLHVSAFVQTRGSMPIYFSQNPFHLKPPPVVERTPAENLAALTQHFNKQSQIYGSQVVVNLAELTGNEAVIVDAYRDGVRELNEKRKLDGKDVDVEWNEFDFHKECRGMKYENVLKLVRRLEPKFDAMGFFWSTSDSVLSKQDGVFRVNCVDCIDRTSVVQSALSRFVFNRFLVNLGLSIVEPNVELDSIVNTLWANNGDAISMEYASSSALKGDYTRTGVRTWRGALSDGSSSLTRLLSNGTQDFFRQAVIDYLLGINLDSIAEFSSKLVSSDPEEICRLSDIRRASIDIVAAMVIEESETKVGGWTLLGTAEDTLKGKAIHEMVVLLTKQAVYISEFNYSLMKVVSFVRVPLSDLTTIQKGIYVLALDSASRESSNNYGLVLNYDSKAAAVIRRVNSYSMTSRSFILTHPASPRLSLSTSLAQLLPPILRPTSPPPSPTSSAHFFAFKALRPDRVRVATVSSPSGQSRLVSLPTNEKRTARDVVDEIALAIVQVCESIQPHRQVAVLEKDIISEESARQALSIVDKAFVGLKHLIWL